MIIPTSVQVHAGMMAAPLTNVARYLTVSGTKAIEMLEPSVPPRVWDALGTLIVALRNTLAKPDGDAIVAEINRLLENPTIWEGSGVPFPAELKWEADMQELDRVVRAKLTEIRLSDDGERQARKAKAVALLERMGKELREMGRAA